MFSATQHYALRAMTQLAREESSTTADVAKATNAPAAYLSKAIQHLRRAGLVKSLRGPGGGIWLARPEKKSRFST